MKAVLTGDWHLEAGWHLGNADPELGSTRMADARRILTEITAEEADVLVFLGDMARTATPKPTAYRIAQDALRAAAAPNVLMLVGNHDYTGEATSCVHVTAKALRRAKVADGPLLTTPAGLQIGVLPWTPPARMFDAAPHDPGEMNRLVAKGLVEVAQGLAAKLDRSKPSLLVGHWLLAGGDLQTGVSVIEAGEPLVDAALLEAQGWDAVIFGHNHRHQQVGDRCFHCGPPLRGGFSEQDLDAGYMVVEWDDGGADVRFVATDDRPLVTLDLDGLPPYAIDAELADAVVRVRITCDEAQAEALHVDSGRALLGFVDELIEAGAFKIVGPQVVVERPERKRSQLTVEAEPERALAEWLDQQGINGSLGARVQAEAQRLWA